MKENLITFETAKLANEKGFDEDTFYFYRGENSLGQNFITCRNNSKLNFWDDIQERWAAPTQTLLQKWLREVYNIDVVISPERYDDGVNYIVQAQKWDLKADEEINPNFVIEGSYWFNDNGEYPTYEKALEKGLMEGLKLIK